MRERSPRTAVLTATAVLAAGAILAATATAAVPEEVERNADQWPLPNQDYRNTRSAADPGIDSSNVNELGVAWAMPIPAEPGAYGAAAGGLVAADGVVYFQDLGANVFAIDLGDGEVLWQHEGEAGVSLVGPTGPAIGEGRVYASLDDQRFGALVIETGEELWSVEPDLGFLGAIQPTVFDRTVFYATQAGKSAEVAYAGGQSGVIHAADAATGEDRWTFQVVEEGFWGNPEVNSGGGVWYTPAVDTHTGQTFWGTGNPAPFPGTEEFPNGTSRPGPNRYSSSLLSLGQESGELAWYYQVVEHDLFDHDFQAPPILAALRDDDDRREIVIASGKVGDVVAVDRESGEEIWRTPVGEHENDDLDELPLGEEVTVLPGIYGGVETPMAFSEGMVYVPVVNVPTTHTATAWGATDGTEAVANANQHTPLGEGTGALVAIDASTGEVAWETELDTPVFAGATVSGDLVFTATFDGMMRAFDKASGEEVWTYQAPGGINAWPIIVGDTLVWPVGLGDAPQLLALRPGATGAVVTSEPEPATPEPATPEPATPEPASPAADRTAPDATPVGPAATPEAPDATPEAPDAPALVTPFPTPADETPPAESPSPQPEDGNGQAEVTLELAAQDFAFDAQTLTVPAGAPVSLTLTNRDRVSHNFALYRSDAADEAIFVGEIFAGPDASRTYQFTAPSEPGEYFFRCDVHPAAMNGTFIVE